MGLYFKTMDIGFTDATPEEAVVQAIALAKVSAGNPNVRFSTRNVVVNVNNRSDSELILALIARYDVYDGVVIFPDGEIKPGTFAY